jgi:hypothetical protein
VDGVGLCKTADSQEWHKADLSSNAILTAILLLEETSSNKSFAILEQLLISTAPHQN